MERLKNFLAEIMKWYLAHIERVSIYFHEGRHVTGDRLKEVQHYRRECEGYIRGLISAATDGDIFESVNPKLTTFFLLGALNSVASWYRKSGGGQRRNNQQDLRRYDDGILQS